MSGPASRGPRPAAPMPANAPSARTTTATADRRGQQRVSGPFEISWTGPSGHRHVRVADFSPAGCFVEDIAAPAPGERLTLTLRVPGGGPIEVAGRVVYANPPLGFAVAFEPNQIVASELVAAVRRASQQRR